MVALAVIVALAAGGATLIWTVVSGAHAANARGLPEDSSMAFAVVLGVLAAAGVMLLVFKAIL
jgi:hypothetical protein